MSNGSGELQGLTTLYTTTDVDQSSIEYEPITNNLYSIGLSTTVFEAATADVSSPLDRDSVLEQTEQTTMDTAATADDHKLIVVGTTCAVLGLLLGVAASVLFLIYKKKCNRKNRRRSSVMEKNPKEMTFERLDMSLTTPQYESNSVTGSSLNRPNLTSSTPRYSEPYNFNHEQYTSYQSFELPSPPMRNRANQPAGLHHANSQSWDKFSSIDSRVLTSIQRKKEKHERKPTRISTRESISSGLGTCTESEIYISDTRSPPSTNHTSPESDSQMTHYNTTISSKPIQTERYSNEGDGKATSKRSESARVRSNVDSSILQSSTFPQSHQRHQVTSRNSLPLNYAKEKNIKRTSKNIQPKDTISITSLEDGEETFSSKTKSKETNNQSSISSNESRKTPLQNTQVSHITVIRRNSDATINL